MLRIVIAAPDEGLSLWLADAIAPANGLEVVGTALDGESALEVVRRTHPDVVLVDVDIVMPPQGGLTLVAAIRDAVPDTLVLVLAADALEETAHAALAAGATGVLAKDGSAQIPTDLGWPVPGESRDARPLPRGRQPPTAVHETVHVGTASASTLSGASPFTRERHPMDEQVDGRGVTRAEHIPGHDGFALLRLRLVTRPWRPRACECMG